MVAKEAYLYEFAIIGGGPGGGFLAHQLGEMGFEVILIEASSKFKRKICGEYLCPAGVTLLKNKGFSEFISDNYLPIEGMKLISPNLKVLYTLFPKKKDYEVGVSVKRGHFDQAIVEKAKKYSNVDTLFGERLSGMSLSGTEEKKWDLKTDKGKSIQTKILIGADGRNSFVARTLGLKKKSSKKRVALHCFLEKKREHIRSGEVHFFKDGSYSALDPVEEKLINFSVICDVNILKSFRTPSLAIKHYIKNSSILKEDYGELPEEIKVFTTFPITNRVKSNIDQNLALVGDAAGFVDPLTGEGMYNALWSANCLSQEFTHLKGSLKDSNIKSSLNRYDLKKRKHFRQKIILAKIFQFIIYHPFILELAGKFLIKKPERGHILIGVIGNIYKPIEGLKLLWKKGQ